MVDKPADGREQRGADDLRTFSMRLAGGDADALDRACIDLRAVVGRRVDRSEVMRELVALFLQDDKIRERVATGLEGRKISRGGDVGLGL
jgi:hypothetical protein